MLVPIRMQRVPIGTLYVKKSLIPSLEGRGAVLIFDIFNNKDEDFEVSLHIVCNVLHGFIS